VSALFAEASTAKSSLTSTTVRTQDADILIEIIAMVASPRVRWVIHGSESWVFPLSADGTSTTFVPFEVSDSLKEG
jgi:hypothetical protein